VLEQIVEMPKDEVMLIQGPPGTGKTHTIIGIMSMIMSTRLKNSKQKIMVCAPSNAAIDQIIIRIIERGLIGLRGLRDFVK
jgi:senataxin